jgi:hypothetical protein
MALASLKNSFMGRKAPGAAGGLAGAAGATPDAAGAAAAGVRTGTPPS